MSSGDDSRLEALLRSRSVPPPSSDLAARIVREARGLPQRRPQSILNALASVFAELRLPYPAIALTAALLLGLIAGWTAPLGNVVPDDDAEVLYVQSFLYPEEDPS